jgi:hypothetical protein
MEEFLEKLMALRKKIREESPLYPFLPPDSTFLEEEKTGSGLEITHYGRDTSPEEGSVNLPGEKSKEKPESEEEEEVSFELPGFRELNLSDLGKAMEETPEKEKEKEDPEKKEPDDKSKYIDLVKNLLDEGHIDQALDEIREMKRLENTPEEKEGRREE